MVSLCWGCGLLVGSSRGRGGGPNKFTYITNGLIN